MIFNSNLKAQTQVETMISEWSFSKPQPSNSQPQIQGFNIIFPQYCFVNSGNNNSKFPSGIYLLYQHSKRDYNGYDIWKDPRPSSDQKLLKIDTRAYSYERMREFMSHAHSKQIFVGPINPSNFSFKRGQEKSDNFLITPPIMDYVQKQFQSSLIDYSAIGINSLGKIDSKNVAKLRNMQIA